MSCVRSLKRFSGRTGASQKDSEFSASLFAFQVILEVGCIITVNKIPQSLVICPLLTRYQRVSKQRFPALATVKFKRK